MTQKILFCHIPKTAGTYVSNRLNDKKINYEWYIHKILKFEKDQYTTYYKFTIFRDPIERAVSAYFYSTNKISKLLKNGKLHDKLSTINYSKLHEVYKLYNVTNLESYMSNFEKIYNDIINPDYNNLKNICQNENMRHYYKILFYPQNWFICDDNNNILVDKIIDNKFLNQYLKKEFDIDIKPKSNTHPMTEANYKELITNDFEIIIKKIYKKDYEILDRL